MTEEIKDNTEPAHIEEQPVEEVTKLLIDKPSDFKFHAAYLAYSETWEKVNAPNTRKDINNILVSLSKEEMEYTEFYKILDDYRRHGTRHFEFSRDKIETQRKRDWRQKQTRSQRNERHKGRR
jgi:hypothetical protein